MPASGPDCVKTQNILDFKNSVPKFILFTANNQQLSPLKYRYLLDTDCDLPLSIL